MPDAKRIPVFVEGDTVAFYINANNELCHDCNFSDHEGVLFRWPISSLHDPDNHDFENKIYNLQVAEQYLVKVF